MPVTAMETEMMDLDLFVLSVAQCSQCKEKWESNGLLLLMKTDWNVDIINMVGGALKRCVYIHL